MHVFAPEWRLSPYFTLGTGVIYTDPKANLVDTIDRDDQLGYVGLLQTERWEQLTAEIGRTRITIKSLLQLSQGSVVELDGLAHGGDPALQHLLGDRLLLRHQRLRDQVRCPRRRRGAVHLRSERVHRDEPGDLPKRFSKLFLSKERASRQLRGERQRGVTSALLALARNLGLITGASAMGSVFALGSHGLAPLATRLAEIRASVATTATMIPMVRSLKIPKSPTGPPVHSPPLSATTPRFARLG